MKVSHSQRYLYSTVYTQCHSVNMKIMQKRCHKRLVNSLPNLPGLLSPSTDCSANSFSLSVKVSHLVLLLVI